jgi:site-specific recombinase XerD
MVENYLDYLLSVKGKSQKTINEYRLDLNIFYEFLKERYSKEIDIDILNKINISDLHAFIAYLGNVRDNSNKTKARKIACLKSYFKYLHSTIKVISNNPTIDLEIPKIEKRLPIHLSLEESKKLLSSINNKRDYAIVILFLNCGLRLSELTSIDIANFNDDTLTVVGKGNKERTIYLNKVCKKAIDEYLKTRNSNENALFLSNRNSRFSQKGIQHMLEKYLNKVNLSGKGYSPHKLRHTAATLMYQYGNVDIRALQEILGHESVATTQIYTHIDSKQLRNAINSNPLNI